MIIPEHKLVFEFEDSTKDASDLPIIDFPAHSYNVGDIIHFTQLLDVNEPLTVMEVTSIRHEIIGRIGSEQVTVIKVKDLTDEYKTEAPQSN